VQPVYRVDVLNVNNNNIYLTAIGLSLGVLTEHRTFPTICASIAQAVCTDIAAALRND
jgi:hypothetical protein